MSSAATAAGVAVGLIALVLVAYRGRVAGPGIAAAPAAIAVGYGLIMATSLAGAGIGLLRTLLLSLLPAVALLIADRVAPLLPDAANDRGGPAGAGVVASLAAGAAIAMIGESLSLFGGLGRIGTAVAITLVLVLLVWGSGLRGATAALRASLAIAAVLAGLLLLVGLVVGGPGALLGPTLPPQGLPPGAGWSLSATVLLVALADPALRPRLPAPDWPTTALRRSGAVVLVLLPALTGAAVLFGGSFFSPSSQFFAAWFKLPADSRRASSKGPAAHSGSTDQSPARSRVATRMPSPRACWSLPRSRLSAEPSWAARGRCSSWPQSPRRARSVAQWSTPAHPCVVGSAGPAERPPAAQPCCCSDCPRR